MNSTRSTALARPQVCPDGDNFERIRLIAELKQKIKSGTYLINKYEIIDGLLNELANATVNTTIEE